MSTPNTSGATVATLTLTPRAGSDQIPDAVADEIVRRAVVTVDADDLGNTVFSPTEPTDKTKVWWKTDAVTGIPEGTAMVWSETENAWVSSVEGDAPYVPPKEYIISIPFAAVVGPVARTMTIPDMGQDDYFVDFEVTTKSEGGYNAAPATMADFAICVTNKTNTSVAFTVFNVPTNGLTIRVRCRNPQT